MDRSVCRGSCGKTRALMMIGVTAAVLMSCQQDASISSQTDVGSTADAKSLTTNPQWVHVHNEIDFPRVDRDLTLKDAEAVEQAIMAIKTRNLPCTEVIQIATQLHAAGRRIARSRSQGPIQARLPSSKRLQRAMKALHRKLRSCHGRGPE